ncbi:hypothetical protein M011DRAFT_470431 [Sporormia fimetaria CBS 119925]|uniref:Uncharacterized protein n=1 Tax=Sporormia fimetaria CBS 119925 TaxID=1340428 RepID=A0A6A6V3I1_9PLEO|nr:hypothetical protein M011DRAFT_470431 [Sporormia fimetaria CBS 119925]
MDLCGFSEIRPIPKTAPVSDGLPKPKCAGEPTEGPVAFGWEVADKKILEFCRSDKYWNTILVPSIGMGSGHTADGQGKVLGAHEVYDIGDGNKLYIAKHFKENGCQGHASFAVGRTAEEKIDHCVNRFRKILNGCNSPDLFPKFGGHLEDVCVVYTLTARPEGAEDPRKLDAESGSGKFMCEKTDSQVAGLENTCTCHRERFPDTVDVFKMPDNNDCEEDISEPNISYVDNECRCAMSTQLILTPDYTQRPTRRDIG